MGALLVLLEVFLVSFGAWVAVFETFLYLELPSGWLSWSAALALLLSWLPFARGWIERCRRLGASEKRFAVSVAAVALALATLVLVASRPDPDDVGYFRAPYRDALRPDRAVEVKPFLVQGYELAVPALNMNETWEPLVVTMSTAVGLDPLAVYHNVGAVLAVLLWTVVHALLLRRFRAPRRFVWICLLVGAGFLLLDGDLHRSFGNMSLLRIWQGKVIAFSVLVPAIVLLTLRLFARPTGSRTFYLALAVLAGATMNRSMVPMVGMLIPALAIAFFMAFGWRQRRSRAVVLTVAMSLPLFLLGGWILWTVSGAQLPSDATVSASPSLSVFSSSWSETVFPEVVGDRWGMVRDLIFLFAVPLLAVAEPLRRFLFAYSLVVMVVAFSSLSASLWSGDLALIHWRFYYLLPLPLCFALFPMSLRRWIAYPGSTLLRDAVVPAALIVFFAGMDRPSLSAANGVRLKAPWSYRLDPRLVEISRELAPDLAGHRVLARSDLAWVLGLLEPERVELVFLRDFGSQRKNAELVLAQCRMGRDSIRALRSLARSSTAILMSPCSEATMSELREQLRPYHLAFWKGAEDYLLLAVSRPP